MVSLLYLCVSVIVYLHSCVDNYNIKKCELVHLYWLLHEVTLLSDHCLGPPEPYQKLAGFSMKMRTFYPRHELTSAPFKTRDSSIVEHCGAHFTLSTQSNCCTVPMKAAAVIGRRTESGGSSLVFSGKPFILPSSSSQRHRL